MIRDIDILLNNSIKDKFIPTSVQIEGKPLVKVDLEIIKNQITTNFVKRGLTITDI